MKINLNIIILFVILFSCNRKETNNLKIKILTKEINIPYFDKNLKNDIEKVKNYSKDNGVPIYFKIENNSKFNYIFCPISNSFSKGNTPYEVFPEPLKGLSLNNFIIKNTSNGQIINSKSAVVLGGDDSCNNEKEKSIASFFKITGYKLDNHDALLKGLTLKSLLIIPKRTTLYFESYISLPINSPSFNIQGTETVDIQPKESYSIQMIFSANAKFVKKRLPNNLKETLAKGEFKIFEGNLYSNEVPLVIEQ